MCLESVVSLRKICTWAEAVAIVTRTILPNVTTTGQSEVVIPTTTDSQISSLPWVEAVAAAAPTHPHMHCYYYW